MIFLNNWFGNAFISKKLAWEKPHNDVMLHSDCEITLQKEYFVDWTFGESN